MNPALRFPANPPLQRAPCVRRWLRRATVLVLQVCVLMTSMLFIAGNASADTPAAGSFAGGNGTQGSPWQISNLAELRLFMEDSSPGYFPRLSFYKLTANIDASDTATWFSGLGWLPVDASNMQGFDPAGFEIQNLRINRPTTDYVGFFGKFNSTNGPLANFKFVGGQIAGKDYVGTLIGSGSPTTISNSHSAATVFGRSYVGGLVGLAGPGTIVSSSATGAVKGTGTDPGAGELIGGLVGHAAGTSLSSSRATGPVTGKKQVGGLVGVLSQGSGTGITTSWASGQVDGDDLVGGLIGNSNGKVTFSYATGAVTATGTNPTIAGFALAGGLIGQQQSSARPTEDSWASGAVTGPLSGLGGLIGSNAGPIARSATLAGQTVTGTANASSVGGLVGEMINGSITASRAASTVSSSGSVSSVGGLVGLLGAGTGISNSYATGNVTADGAIQVGGLVGWHTAGTITGSHAEGNVLGMSSVGGLIGLSTNFAVTTSYATGSVYGTTLVGGLIGSRGNGLTDTTFATGTVTANGDYAGGLIGLNSGTLKKSYATKGTVTGQKWVGGLVGYNPGSVETSYALKDVSGTTYVGGLLGQTGSNSTIKDCYAKGSVSGFNQVGGLVGGNSNGSSITRCYASGTVPLFGATSVGGLIGDNQSGGVSSNYWNTLSTGSVSGIGTGSVTTGVTGRNATQMMMQTSFAGFVFPSPWRIDEGISQPYFDYGMTGQVASTTSLVSSVNPSVSGQSVTFTASVAPNTATGTVLFQEGTTPLPGCVAVTVTAGQAQCSISTLAVGPHGISAVYSGDGGNLGSTSSTLNQNVIPPSLDIDASNTQTKYHAPTDGLLTVRYLFGLTRNSLVAGVVFGVTATRTDPVAIKSYLDSIRPQLDIDGNNSVNALTDGLLIIRNLLGLTGDALISGAVDLQLGTRKTAADVKNYLQLLMP